MSAGTTSVGPSKVLGTGAPRFDELGIDDARRTLLVALGVLLSFAPLRTVFTDAQWLIEATGAVACVIVPAALLRLRSAPRAWQVVPGLVLLVLYSAALYLDRATFAGFIPNSHAWIQIQRVHQLAVDDVQNNVVPLDSTMALRSWIVPSLGLFAALVDVTAVVRRAAAIAGVPMLALFTTCGAIAGHAVGWQEFLVAAIGYLVVLSADASVRLRTWGRLLRRRTGDQRRTRLSLSGRRIGAIALAVAVLVPVFIPGLSRNLLSDSFHRGGGNGSGGGGGTSLSPFADLRGSLSEPTSKLLARVNVNAVDVSGVKVSSGIDPFYLRSIVLDEFTDSGWRMSSAFAGEAVTPPNLATTLPQGGRTMTFTARITVAALADVAPLFAFPQNLNGLGGSWRYNRSTATLGKAKTRTGQVITEQVVQPDASVEELSAATDDVGTNWLGLPSDLPEQVTALVTRLTAGATSRYAMARAMSDYFRDPDNGFVYSLSTVAGDSGSDLVDFLTNKTGYCQQYAAALGVMFRAAGIPARVVLGYTHGQADKSGNFTITSHDAHAWVEGYFGGIGWIPFDPTPLSGADATRAVALPYEQQPPASVPSTGASGPTAGPSREVPTRVGPSTTGATSATASSRSTLPVPRWLILLALGIALVVVVALVLPALRWRGRRRRFRAALSSGRVEPLWGELHAAAVDTGTDWAQSTTPRQVPAWLAERGVALPAAVDQLARAVETERYARIDGQPAGREVPADVSASIERVRTISRAMHASLGPRARLRSALLPPSVLAKAKLAKMKRLPRRTRV